MYDEDCPELTGEQLASMRPRYPEHFQCLKIEAKAVEEMAGI